MGFAVQAGALPWRLHSGKEPEVLLVTGRRSGRWIIPKGWPMPGKSLAESAAREAFEEAGVAGRTEPTPIGTFRYVKQHLLFGPLEIDVHVHPMAVDTEIEDWPERADRSRKWFSAGEAANRVDSVELSRLILGFAQSLKRDRAR